MQYESICLHWWKIIAKQTNHLCHIEQDPTPGVQQLDNCKNERQTDRKEQRENRGRGEKGTTGFDIHTLYAVLKECYVGESLSGDSEIGETPSPKSAK